MKKTKVDLRDCNGILLLDKPPKLTSNRALQIVKRLFLACKAGHTGSLDPLATGMLPICFGRATKLATQLLAQDKCYQAIAQLGIKTNTGDAEGIILQQKPVLEYSLEDLENVFQHFRGKILQVPSMFSALKYEGEPLYKLARRGIEVPRQPREIEIYNLNLINYSANQLTLNVHCSKGTYIRNLVEDIGEMLGCGAHIISLRRYAIGNFTADQMYTLQQLEERCTNGILANLDNCLIQ